MGTHIRSISVGATETRVNVGAAFLGLSLGFRQREFRFGERETNFHVNKLQTISVLRPDNQDLVFWGLTPGESHCWYTYRQDLVAGASVSGSHSRGRIVEGIHAGLHRCGPT